ncbi:hypothetical protein FOZ62_002163, partial [Perkinsus olseni]
MTVVVPLSYCNQGEIEQLDKCEGAKCAKQRLTSEFLDAEPVKDIVGRAVHPHPVKRFVEVAGRIFYTVDHTTNPDCLPDSGTAVIYFDGTVLPGQWAGSGIAFDTITGEGATSGRKLPSHSNPMQAEILGIWLAASTGSTQPHVGRVVVISDCMRAIDTLTGKSGSLTSGRLAQLVLDRLSKLG